MYRIVQMISVCTGSLELGAGVTKEWNIGTAIFISVGHSGKVDAHFLIRFWIGFQVSGRVWLVLLVLPQNIRLLPDLSCGPLYVVLVNFCYLWSFLSNNNNSNYFKSLFNTLSFCLHLYHLCKYFIYIRKKIFMATSIY
jgi:hypothetical protein